MEIDVSKLKAKAAFYSTYAAELEKQEPFNNKDIINAACDEHVIYDTSADKCEAFTLKQAAAIKRALVRTAEDDNGNIYELDIYDYLGSESVNIQPILSKIECLTEDK